MVALVELIAVVTIPAKSSGANIGLSFAVLAVLAAGRATYLTAWALRMSQASGDDGTPDANCLPSLIVAGLAILLVGIGILEELA